MILKPFDSDEIRILRSMTLSQRFELGVLFNRCALDRYRQKLAGELPEWTDTERERLVRAARVFGMIDTEPRWLEVYNSPEFQASLSKSKTGV